MSKEQIVRYNATTRANARKIELARRIARLALALNNRSESQTMISELDLKGWYDTKL